MKRSIVVNKFQRGAAALLVSTVLLFSVSMVTLFTSKTVMMEQKISANQVRSIEALESAQAGLEYVLAYVKGGGGADQDGDGNIDVISVPAGTLTPAPAITMCNYRATGYVACGCTPGTADAPDGTTFEICVTGSSADGTATRTIRYRGTGIGLFQGGGPTHPVVARTTVNMIGEAKIHNTETNATIWTGQTVTMTGNKFITFIADGSSSGGEVAISRPADGTLGFDIVDQDPQLVALTGDEFFQSFFSGTKADIKATADTISCSAAEVQPGRFVWCDGSSTLSVGSVGNSSSAPAIVVTEGDFKITGNSVFYGIIYVMGEVQTSGTPQIHGSLIGEGEDTNGDGIPDTALKVNGTPDIYYKRYFEGGGDGVGMPSRDIRVDTASWRDF
ncbi:hypothetical protein D5085_12410 [Ectothiorhodospiraceae bacterium BW-2]|nr:hypothetical protein D5085_12410 [Ectothiorhodospiraceae bacterium BW-2]